MNKNENFSLTFQIANDIILKSLNILYPNNFKNTFSSFVYWLIVVSRYGNNHVPASFASVIRNLSRLAKFAGSSFPFLWFPYARKSNSPFHYIY